MSPGRTVAVEYSATCQDSSSSMCPVSTPTIFFLIEKYGRWFFA